MKKRISSIARVIACATFLILTIIGVSSIVRAMSLETIANEDGIPASWKAASLGDPDSITVPANFWDQRQDDCDDPNRQFEWVICGYWTAGALQGIVKDTLGSDGRPVPAYTTAAEAWAAHRDVFTVNVIGNDPVQPTDNFYRWFHETSVSKRYDRKVVFNRVKKGTYVYGRDGVFPLDDVTFSDGDSAWDEGHNYHFTSHMRIPIKISASGKERFEFSGDDDVWIFLNNKLVLDIGGLHEKLEGWFQINTDGTVTTYVQNVNDVSVRDQLGEPSNDFNGYVDPLNQLNRATFKDQYRTIDIGLNKGDVVNLDFFYAERSTVESNTKVTITDMNWPISADSDITGKVVGRIEDTESNLVQFNTSVTNRDPESPLILERLAAYIQDDAEGGEKVEGFIPLTSSTLYYTTTPDDESSWQPVEISAPSEATSGFNLATPLTMTPNGEAGDTLYFRYFAETNSLNGEMTGIISYYTTLNGLAGVTYDQDTVSYNVSPSTPPVDPEDPDPTPEDPETPTPDPNEPEVPPEPEEPEIPTLPQLPPSDLIDGELTYLAPLGEIAYVPNTGIIKDAVAAVFEVGFAELILSQSFVMAVLLIFAASFATWFSLRKFANFDPAVRTYTAKKSHPKMPTSKKVTPRAKSGRNAHVARTRSSKTVRKTTKK